MDERFKVPTLELSLQLQEVQKGLKLTQKSGDWSGTIDLRDQLKRAANTAKEIRDFTEGALEDILNDLFGELTLAIELHSREKLQLLVSGLDEVRKEIRRRATQAGWL